MKLMIAIPTLDYVHFEFTNSLVGLVKRLEHDGVDYEVCFLGGTLIYKGRDTLAAEAVNQKYTHVLWLDADMKFDPDVLYKLMRHEEDFVTGIYRSRHSPYRSTLFSSLDPIEWIEEFPEHLFEVVACGFGCVLMTTNIIRSVYRQYGCCFQPLDGFGEDISFCMRARELGYTLFCDPEVRLGHIGHVVVYPDLQTGR